MENKKNSNLLVNVFALPNQSNLIFAIIVFVLLGSVTLGSLGTAPVPFWPVTILMILLSFRYFLAFPDREIKKLELIDEEKTVIGRALILETIANISQKLELRKVPNVLIKNSKDQGDISTFGSFRHWYIVMSAGEAEKLGSELANEETSSVAQARLIHELYHFKNGDNWKMGYSKALLRTTFLFMAWMMVFFMGYILLIMVAIEDIFSSNFSSVANQIHNIAPELDFMGDIFVYMGNEIAEVSRQASQVDLSLVLNYMMSAIMPYILISAVLLLVFYRKLWRLRELYADAGVIHLMGESKSFISARTGIPKKFLFIRKDESEAGTNTPIEKKVSIRIRSFIVRAKNRFRRLAKWHPSNDQRLDCARNPEHIYDSWIEMALLLGSLLLMLDIILASPLVLIYTSTLPMHFTVLSVIILVSFNLVPGIVTQTKPVINSLKAIGLVSAIRLVWLVFTLGFMFLLYAVAPEMFADIMRDAIASVARYAGSVPVDFGSPEVFLIEAAIANTAQVLIIFFISSLAVIVNGLLFRSIFDWYTIPNASKNIVRIIFAAIGVSMLFWGAGVLLPLSLAFSVTLQANSGIVLAVTIFTWVLTGIATVFFVKADRKYSHRCPNCGEILPDGFALNTPCGQCQKRPLSWLLLGERL